MRPPSTLLPARRRPLLAIVVIVVLLTVGAGLARCGGGDGPQLGVRYDVSTTTSAPTTTTATTTTEPAPPPPGPVPDPSAIDVLVDPERSLPIDHRPDDLVVPPIHWITADDGERRLLRGPAADALATFFVYAAADGHPLVGVSGFRSYGSQALLYARSQEGERPDDSGQDYVAPPGHSEHQTGLAIDIVGADGVCVLEPCFAATAAGHWVADNASRFGFVVRYPAGKEEITGYAHEPWHLRFVGVDLATALTDAGETLDEHHGVDP